MIIRNIIILLLLAIATNAVAQTAAPAGDTVLKSATIEVVQTYKPQVKQVPKPEWVPQLPVHDTTHPVFKYDVPPQILYYTYSSLPLHPLALGIDSGKMAYPNYVKAGGGNLSTLYLDAGIGSLCGPGYETAIHLHSISQEGNIKYQQTALSGIEADGTLHKTNNDWHAFIDAERNQYYYYGYTDNEPKDTLKQTYTTIRVGVDMMNKDSAESKINYHPALTASLYDAHFGSSETNIGFNAPVTYKIDTSLQAQVALVGALTWFRSTLGGYSNNFNNNYAVLLPGFSYHKNLFTGHALLGLAAAEAGGYILPDICGALAIPNTSFIASAGWLATLRQNTYEQLTTENPYLLNTYNALQTRKDEVFVNVQGNAGQHLTFSGRLSWNAYDNLPTFSDLYITPFKPYNEKQFFIIYQQVKAVSLHLAARYQVANTWSAGITGDFYDFYKSSEQYVWEQPGTKIKGDFMIKPVPKLTVTAYLALLGDLYAENAPYDAIKLKTIADLGGNAEYQFIPRLSVFLQVSNLFNDKYQRWIGYEAYGINVYGGLRLKF